MNKNNIVYLILLCIITFTSCKSDYFEEAVIVADKVHVDNVPPVNLDRAKKGKIVLKLKRDDLTAVSFSTKNGVVKSNVKTFNTLISNIKVKKIERVFPHVEKYAKRQRKAGLHLWYVVSFDENVSVLDAIRQATEIKEIDKIEPIYDVEPPRYHSVEVPPTAKTFGGGTKPFNDPYLDKQWHYENYQPLAKTDPEADISLFGAWEKETGKPNVIVAIVDGGVDFEHEDLKGNMWVNEKEKNGTPGVDDDNNGFIDDIYGVNCVTATENGSNAAINPGEHGTHVAGTVAAKNNNNIGVCGIAGGNGDANSGVRLMGCQIFDKDKATGNDLPSNHNTMARAITYAADNGAVIAQCSWGFTSFSNTTVIPSILKDAIDYFIKYAGCDDNGNQLATSPMKGGILCFASGNNGDEYERLPAAYDAVIAVTATDAKLRKAIYSTYGNYVDISAPGGTASLNNPQLSIYSTLPENKYGYMDGTSMACPHVSGVASLIVSKFGGAGFTHKELRKRLLGGVKNINIDKRNPMYAGKMGVGYLDALNSLGDINLSDNKKPTTPKFIKVIPDFISVNMEWEASDDENDNTPNVYRVYYSKKMIDKNNYKNAKYVTVAASGYNAGETVKYTLQKLHVNTHYYFAIEAVDRWGEVSDGQSFTDATTKENNYPIITRMDDKVISITGSEREAVKLKVEDPDGHKWGYFLSGYDNGVSVEREEDILTIKFQVQGKFGEHQLKVVVEDEYGGRGYQTLSFDYHNTPPQLLKGLENIYVNIGDTYTVDLTKYFKDPEGKKMIFDAYYNKNIIKASLDESVLSIEGTTKGKAVLALVAEDNGGEVVKNNINVFVVDNPIVRGVYPLKTHDILNVVVSEGVYGIKLRVRTPFGKNVFSTNQIVTSENRTLQLNLSGLSAGSYILYAETDAGKTFEQAFIKY